MAVAPTLAPSTNSTTARPIPDFVLITPPPIRPDLPDPPTLGRPQGDGLREVKGIFNLLVSAPANPSPINPVQPSFATITLRGLFAPGVIAAVDLQFLNLTKGTDITNIFFPTAIAQFKNLLIGRGNTYIDRLEGITFFLNPDTNSGQPTFTFPANPTQYTLAISNGDVILVILVIRDSFNQTLRLEARANAGQPSPSPSPSP
ncbi:MAG: hypothetical protein ACUVRV_03965, partial [Cyanobacteriota bacterium]